MDILLAKFAKIIFLPRNFMFNLDELLNTPVEQFIAPEPEKAPKQPTFSPNPKTTKNQVYSAIVRFLPNRYDTTASSFRTVSHWLESDTEKGFFQCKKSCFNFLQIRRGSSKQTHKRHLRLNKDMFLSFQDMPVKEMS